MTTKVTVTWQDTRTDPKNRSITILAEVKALSETPLEDALFQIPADYQKLDTH